MGLTKNDVINEVVTGLVCTLDKDQLELVKATFVIKMQGYEIHQVNTLPAVEVINNDFILQRFAVDMVAKGLKESTIKAYMDIIKPFFLYTGKDYREVTAQDITDYFAVKRITKNARGQRNSQTYVSNICRGMFVFFQWLYQKHHIAEDIIRDVDRIKPKQKKKERLTPEEIEACREVLRDDKEKALYEFMLSTGARVGEIAKLRIEDIDFQSRRVCIHGEKSESAERNVYISIRAKNALEKYLKGRYGGFVFRPSRKALADNKPIGNGSIEKLAKEIGERAGVHCITTVHVYRKTFASELYAKTKDVKLVSILLGHANTAVTEKYYLIDDIKDVEYKALSVA